MLTCALPNSDGFFTCTLFGDFTLLNALTTLESVDCFSFCWLDLIPDIAAQ